MSAIPKTETFTVSVRALADFNQTQGNLIGSFRPSPSAFEGQQTHKLTQTSRSEAYRAEVSLSTLWQCRDFVLKISGRADGVFEDGIEEIKTSRIPAQEIPDSAKELHRIQARIYGALYALSTPTSDSIQIIVTYVHPQTLQQWPESETWQRADLIDQLVSYCARYDRWLQKLRRQRQNRAVFLNQLRFPFPTMRDGQRQMAEAVYKACCTGKHVTIEAPTGTGKTLAALFPAMKAMPKAQTQSLFFLTMKTTGREAAEQALTKLDPDKHLTNVYLSAKKRLCLQQDSVCDGDYCPYAEDYYGKRERLRDQLFSQTHWHDEALKQFGEQNSICPYYMSQDWAIWSDIVVADLNYIYDTTAVQPYLLKEINNNATLLIDESHNLIDRGRMIFSDVFEGRLIQQLLGKTPIGVQKALRKLQSALRKACKDRSPELSSDTPSQLCAVLRDFVAQSPVLLRDHQSYTPDNDWQELIFACTRFARLNELANPTDFRWRYQQGKPEARSVELLCLNPGALLQSKHNLVNNVVAFSATLKPWPYTNFLNGLAQAVTQELPSPFSAEQYQVFIASDVSTRFADRHQLASLLQQTLQTVINSAKNSMVFFSSYQQLKICTQTLATNSNLLIQSPSWKTEERDAALSRFQHERGLTMMTVLGGVFSEGIDLPGVQLEQVVIVGPGLPQVNDVNNAIRQLMDSQQHPGFDFAYLFPGLQKVLQAAGRCVRTETDQGQILLIDDRFVDYYKRQWLPSFWSVRIGPLAQWLSPD
ncbi:MAG: helicase C-terminal domain-containing protein [Reinekea sp.]|nr:helicase C-terminal domain-containing protein [Reinekea sp.]